MAETILALSTAAAAAASAAGTGTAFTILGVSVTYGALLSSAISIGGGLLATAFQDTTVPQTKITSEAQVTTPNMRYAYGRFEQSGYVAFRYVLKGTYYMGIVLNDRASDSIVSIKVNDSPQTLHSTTNLTNGTGTYITAGPFASSGGIALAPIAFWLQLGGDVRLPASWVTEIGADVSSSDSWGNVTMLWVKMQYGGSKANERRWKGRFPTFLVDGYWSKLYDPRDGSHNPADPTTWDWSNNQALVALDLIRDSRALAIPDFQIDIPSFTAAANVADELVSRKAGGTVPRYSCNGKVVLESRDYRLLDEVVKAGASRLVRVGGVHRIIPGKYVAPSITLKDPLGDQFEFSEQGPGVSLYDGIRTKFVSAVLAYAPDDLPELVTGTGDYFDSLDLALVTEPTQAMRLQRIRHERSKLQKALTGTFPFSALALGPGDPARVQDPAFPLADGIYEVTSIKPRFISADGASMIVAEVSLQETAANPFSWNPATMEQDYTPTYTGPAVTDIQPPAAVTAVSVIRSVETGGVTVEVPAIEVTITESTSGAAVVEYQVRYREEAGTWVLGPTIPSSYFSSAQAVIYLEGLTLGYSYDVGVQAVGAVDESTFVTVSGIILGATAPGAGLTPPYSLRVDSNIAGTVTISAICPNDAAVATLRFFEGGTTLATLSAVLGTRQSASITLTNGVHKLFAKTATSGGALSSKSNTISVTVSGGADP